MPETRVPVTLRDQFLEDPFFRSGWEGLAQKSESVVRRESQEQETSDRSVARPWLLPRRWMIPKLWEESFPEMKDSHLLSMKEDAHKLEISLDTAGYKPDELKVQVSHDELCVEGKHEEKSQAGHVMVSRQFSRRYGLPQGAKREEVESNLSQDGVMVITVPKEKKIEEVKAGDNIQVEHVKNVGEMNKKVEDQRRKSREEQKSEEFSSMQKRSSSVSRSEERTSKERTEVKETGSNRGFRDEMLVPMTLRDPFLEDPFFKSTLTNIENSRGDFFKKARESFEQSLKQMESMMAGSGSMFSNDWMKPLNWDSTPFDSMSQLKDNCVIKQTEDDNKLEVHLDTVGYKPDELKVEVGQGVVRVEGKHEEKSQAGHVMVSKQFSRQYGLPQGSRPEEVVSSLSKDGVLVVTIPKQAPAKLKNRAVPIALK